MVPFPGVSASGLGLLALTHDVSIMVYHLRAGCWHRLGGWVWECNSSVTYPMVMISHKVHFGNLLEESLHMLT